MKRNLYYRTTQRRENLLKKIFFDFVQWSSSYPRLLLEVFVRKDFGERYFRLWTALWVTFLLALWPVLKTKFINPIRHIWNDPEVPHHVSGHSIPHHHAVPEAIPLKPDEMLMPHYMGWYIFLGLFLVCSIIRRIEISRKPSTFNFDKYSLSNGRINPLFFKIHLPGGKTSPRLIETFWEPVFFFIAGYILWRFFHQSIGLVVVISSVFYSLSYIADYTDGDNFVMDEIDQMIGNNGLEKSFVDGVDGNTTGGATTYTVAPEHTDLRHKALPLTPDETDTFEAR